jgi:transcription elongation factor Elf1
MPYIDEFGSWSNGLEEAGLTPWATRRREPHPIYGVGWTEQLREQIRDRADRECTVCGMSEETSIEEFDRRLDVHHICGARTSSNPAVFNAPRNLLTVCHTCHHYVEQYSPGLPPEIEQPWSGGD